MTPFFFSKRLAVMACRVPVVGFFFRVIILFCMSWNSRMRLELLLRGRKGLSNYLQSFRDKKIDKIIVVGSGLSISNYPTVLMESQSEALSIGLNFASLSSYNFNIYTMEFSRGLYDRQKETYQDRLRLYNETLGSLITNSVFFVHVSCLDPIFDEFVPRLKNKSNVYYYGDVSFVLCEAACDFFDHMRVCKVLRKLHLWPDHILLGPVSLLKFIDFASLCQVASVDLVGFDGGGRYFWEDRSAVKAQFRGCLDSLPQGSPIHPVFDKENLPLMEIMEGHQHLFFGPESQVSWRRG